MSAVLERELHLTPAGEPLRSGFNGGGLPPSARIRGWREHAQQLENAAAAAEKQGQFVLAERLQVQAAFERAQLARDQLSAKLAFDPDRPRLADVIKRLDRTAEQLQADWRVHDDRTAEQRRTQEWWTRELARAEERRAEQRRPMTFEERLEIGWSVELRKAYEDSRKRTLASVRRYAESRGEPVEKHVASIDAWHKRQWLDRIANEQAIRALNRRDPEAAKRYAVQQDRGVMYMLDAASRDPVLKSFGKRVELSNGRDMQPEHIRAALSVAASKVQVMKLTGSDEWKKAAVREAVGMGLAHRIGNPELRRVIEAEMLRQGKVDSRIPRAETVLPPVAAAVASDPRRSQAPPRIAEATPAQQEATRDARMRTLEQMREAAKLRPAWAPRPRSQRSSTQARPELSPVPTATSASGTAQSTSRGRPVLSEVPSDASTKAQRGQERGGMTLH